MKNNLIILGIALLFLISDIWTYGKGMNMGIKLYKQSYNMYLTLKSAYHYGYLDCEEGLPEDWDNGGD